MVSSTTGVPVTPASNPTVEGSGINRLPEVSALAAGWALLASASVAVSAAAVTIKDGAKSQESGLAVHALNSGMASLLSLTCLCAWRGMRLVSVGVDEREVQ